MDIKNLHAKGDYSTYQFIDVWWVMDLSCNR